MDKIDTKQIANQRLDSALSLIERAQELMSRACGELAPIVNADKQWEMISAHHDLTKNLWRSINESANRNLIDLDSDARARLIDNRK